MSRYLGIVGKFTHEGIVTALKTHDLEAKHINLFRVSVRTWQKRIEELRAMREGGHLAGLILHLPTPMVIEGSSFKYKELWAGLLNEARQTKSITFIYTDNLSGKFRPLSSETGKPVTDEEFELWASNGEEFGSSTWRWRFKAVKDAEARADEVNEFIDQIYKNKIEIMPFYKRDDITIKIESFLDEVQNNIFMRLYVPSNRFQAEQFESLIRTFERYLRQVEARSFRIESRATGSGTLYVFCAEGEEPFQSLEEAFGRFDQFMKTCRDDPEYAMTLMQSPALSSADIRFLVAKYARDYQRILMDIKHEFQQKMLLLSQRFDLEKLEFSDRQTMNDLIKGGPSALLDISGNTGSLTINIDLSSRGQYNEIGAIINSGSSYNEDEEKILELINKNTDRATAIQLRSDLDQAKAEEIPEADKKVARGRISSFLYTLGAKATEEFVKNSITHLITYVMKGLGA